MNDELAFPVDAPFYRGVIERVAREDEIALLAGAVPGTAAPKNYIRRYADIELDTRGGIRRVRCLLLDATLRSVRAPSLLAQYNRVPNDGALGPFLGSLLKIYDFLKLMVKAIERLGSDRQDTRDIDFVTPNYRAGDIVLVALLPSGDWICLARLSGAPNEFFH